MCWRPRGGKSSVFLIKTSSTVNFIILRFTQEDRNQEAENNNPQVLAYFTYFSSTEWHASHTIMVYKKKKKFSYALPCLICTPPWHFPSLSPIWQPSLKSSLPFIGPGCLCSMTYVLTWQLEMDYPWASILTAPIFHFPICKVAAG